MVREIALTRGKTALIDDDDFERVSAHRWWAFPPPSPNTCWYAYTQIKRKTVHLHAFVMRTKPGEQIDHADRNGLNCQKANLRFATSSQQIQNQAKRSGCASQFKGVTFERGRWRARIWPKEGAIHLGKFNDETEAARAYDAKARELFGEFACLNLPDEART